MNEMDRYERPWLLLCEGMGDKRFFESLFKENGIGADFHIRYPHKDGKYNGGRSNFGSDLLAISMDETFITNVKAVLVVSDNDTAESFAEVQTELKQASLAIPDAAEKVASQKSGPKVVVLMVPRDCHGNLESLCLTSAYDKWPLKEPLDKFVAECPAKDWSIGKQSKMRMQTILAATNDSQPDCGFGAHWNQKDKHRIPLDHASFTGLTDFLKNFEAMVA